MSAWVADTHALVWYAGGRTTKLGKRARRAFEAFDRGEATLYVPAPVAIEIWLLEKNGTLQIDGGLARWWRALARPELVHLDLTLDDLLVAARLDLGHADVFDRLVVAQALRVDCPLLTRDTEITDWGGVDVAW